MPTQFNSIENIPLICLLCTCMYYVPSCQHVHLLRNQWALWPYWYGHLDRPQTMPYHHPENNNIYLTIYRDYHVIIIHKSISGSASTRYYDEMLNSNDKFNKNKACSQLVVIHYISHNVFEQQQEFYPFLSWAKTYNWWQLNYGTRFNDISCHIYVTALRCKK